MYFSSFSSCVLGVFVCLCLIVWRCWRFTYCVLQLDSDVVGISDIDIDCSSVYSAGTFVTIVWYYFYTCCNDALNKKKLTK